MSLLQRLRFETVSSLAFLFEVFKAVPQWGEHHDSPQNP